MKIKYGPAYGLERKSRVVLRTLVYWKNPYTKKENVYSPAEQEAVIPQALTTPRSCDTTKPVVPLWAG